SSALSCVASSTPCSAASVSLASILFRAKVLRAACLCLKTVLDTSITAASDKWLIAAVAVADKRLGL
ncbi:MAG: hypothetical protein SO145_00660, partial [Collinsella sp.]|nr:hypothetical protein [Collinsella sp.]